MEKPSLPPRPTFARPKAPTAVMVRRAVPAPAAVSGLTWICTHTGVEFEPLRPDPAKIHLADIAHALSNVARYTGHSRTFYSVAEHSYRVLTYVESLRIAGADPADSARRTREAHRWALMHDAAEAYMADIAAPIKSAPEFAPYRKAERDLEHAIARRFGLPSEMPIEVKIADRVLLASEWPIVWGHLPTLPRIWTGGQSFPRAVPWVVDGLGWAPERAASMFLQAAERIGIK